MVSSFGFIGFLFRGITCPLQFTETIAQLCDLADKFRVLSLQSVCSAGDALLHDGFQVLQCPTTSGHNKYCVAQSTRSLLQKNGSVSSTHRSFLRSLNAQSEQLL